MSAHTPGPWQYDEVEGFVFAVSDGGLADRDICEVSEIDGSAEDFAAVANARLICAAPDLLVVLGALADRIEMCWPGANGELVLAARAAIAKARGGK